MDELLDLAVLAAPPAPTVTRREVEDLLAADGRPGACVRVVARVAHGYVDWSYSPGYEVLHTCPVLVVWRTPDPKDRAIGIGLCLGVLGAAGLRCERCRDADGAVYLAVRGRL